MAVANISLCCTLTEDFEFKLGCGWFFGQTGPCISVFLCETVIDIIMAAARAGNGTTLQKFYNAFRSWYIYAAGYRQLGKPL